MRMQMSKSVITRRSFLRQMGAVVCATAVAAGSAGALAGAAPASQSRPNIVMILADDLGYGDLSSYGAKDMRTPNIDALVAGGMSFNRFYASCTVCSPTRAALLTGRYPAMVGVPGVIRTQDQSSFGYLSPSTRTIGELLKPAGYDTALVGKWHLGLESPNLPNDRGFDLFEGFIGDMMDSYYAHRRGGKNFMRHNGETIDPKGHATDLFTQWACDYISGRTAVGTKPFFLYLAYNAPHYPVMPPKEYLEKVMARQPGIDKKRAALVALIEHLDDGIGKVLAAIKSAGLADNTLVVFTSDNGGDLKNGGSNGGLREGKGTQYEGGLRVPACAVWPGHMKPGSKTDRVTLTMDLMPTFLEVAGVTPPVGIEGRSILPTLLGQAQAPETRHLFFSHYWIEKNSGHTQAAVLHGDWKLVQNTPGEPLELYHLKDDPQEKTNLAGASPRPAQYDELKAELDKYVKSAAAVEWRRPSQRKQFGETDAPADGVREKK